MKRRVLLSAAAAIAAGFAGCLENADESYEPCTEDVLVYEKLPEGAKAEVDTALEEGAYETTDVVAEEEILYETVEGRSVKALRKDGTYYESRIEEESVWLGAGTKRTLSFQEIAPTSDDVKSLLLRNTTEKPWTGTVAVEDADGERIVEETVTIESYPEDETPDDVESKADERDRLTEIPATDEYGRYDVTFASEDGTRERIECWFTMGYPPQRDRYAITDDGIEYDETLHGAVERPGHPSTPCTWFD